MNASRGRPSTLDPDLGSVDCDGARGSRRCLRLRGGDPWPGDFQNESWRGVLHTVGTTIRGYVAHPVLDAGDVCVMALDFPGRRGRTVMAVLTWGTRWGKFEKIA